MTASAAPLAAPVGWSLSRLFARLDAREVVDGDRRVYLPGALNQADIQRILTLAQFDQILASGLCVAPTVKLVQDDVPVPPAKYTVRARDASFASYIDTCEIFRLFHQGASIVVRDAHRFVPELQRLTWDLAADLGCAVTANVYCSPPQAQGFFPHFDYHDVIVIQLAGSKWWGEFAENADLPLHNNNWRAVEQSVDAAIPGYDAVETSGVDLEVGDVLYVPRGNSHVVRSRSTISLHVTLALQRETLFDVASTVLADVRHVRELRGDRGRRPFGDAAAAAANAISDAGRLRPDALEWELTRRSHQELAETAVQVTTQHFAASELTSSSLLERRRHLLCEVEGSVLRLRHRTLRLPDALDRTLAMTMSGRVVSAEQLAAATGVDVETAMAMLRLLLAEGVITPALHGESDREASSCL